MAFDRAFLGATDICVQGIHDISLLLGFEASRDLEEETFTGVSRCDRHHRQLANGLGLANPYQSVHWIACQAQDWIDTRVARGSWDDGRVVDTVPVSILCIAFKDIFVDTEYVIAMLRSIILAYSGRRSPCNQWNVGLVTCVASLTDLIIHLRLLQAPPGPYR